MKKIIMAIFLLLTVIHLVNAAEIPTINSYITDNAGILSHNVKSQLEDDLRELGKSTSGVQFVVYIENEFPKEYSLEEYTLKIAETNKIGKKGNDNGILLYVAVNDRKYRWEVGYGVESTLNSARLGRISREYIVPNFRNNDYENGILEVVDVTSRVLLNSNDPDIVKLREDANKNAVYSKYSVLFGLSILLMIFIILYIGAKFEKKLKKGGHYRDHYYTGAAGGIFWGGFGRGGSGLGGFSGGGTFGGGGFSGKW